EDEEQLDKTLLVRDQLPHLEKIVVIDTRGIQSLEDPATISLEELEALGDQRFQRSPREWRDSVASLPGGPDVAIVVYTSGAAGPTQGRQSLPRQPDGPRRGRPHLLRRPTRRGDPLLPPVVPRRRAAGLGGRGGAGRLHRELRRRGRVVPERPARGATDVLPGR